MIAPLNAHFASAPLEHIGGKQPVPQGISTDGQQRPEKADKVRISDQAREKQSAQANESAGIKDQNNLSEEEKREVEKLKQQDQEIKAHERAHMAAGAGVVRGGASYKYEHGPDGKMYAVSGEVKIDTSKENDPEATIRKMQQVKKAALAPAQPSAQDRSVAAKAAQIEAEARIELQEQKAKEAEENSPNPEESPFGIAADPFADPSNSDSIGHNLSIMA